MVMMMVAPMIVAADPCSAGPLLRLLRNHRCGRIQTRHLNACYSVTSEAKAFCRCLRKINSASVYKWTAIVNSHHHRLAIVEICHARIGAERQHARSCGKAMGIKSLASTGGMSIEARAIP